MLKDSVSDLRSTLADLEKRQHSVDGEENEWRTRYETQLELNEQLEKQISVVQERLETLRGDPSDASTCVLTRSSDIKQYQNCVTLWNKMSTNEEVIMTVNILTKINLKYTTFLVREALYGLEKKYFGLGQG
uniref:Coiled-coil domain containing 169 n=1 Tax=Sinocyclocheilus anshuiensis TaxID=1608454 RepID=A0A671P6R3_9TELE